jgi:mitochondrial import receptor subunit TOM40
MNAAGFSQAPPTADLSGSSSPDSVLLDPSVNAANPGSYEELHKKTKEVFPIIFEGFKFSLNKMLSSHFQVNHSMTLSSVIPSGYKFGATYVGTNQYTPMEVTNLNKKIKTTNTATFNI